MSTRATAHFYDSADSAESEAIVFRHRDGYPKGMGADILDFFAAVEKQAPNDTRFNDASLLASRYVVWLARQFAVSADPKAKGYKEVSHANKRPLDFLSVRVMREDSADVEFRYHIYCGGEYQSDGVQRPTVMVESIHDDGVMLPLAEAIEPGFPVKA